MKSQAVGNENKQRFYLVKNGKLSLEASTNKLLYLFIRSRLLCPKLIAWERQNFQTWTKNIKIFRKTKGPHNKLVATCLKLKITGCLFKCSTYSQVVQLVYNKWLFIKDVKIKANNKDLQQVLCRVKSVYKHLFILVTTHDMVLLW